MCAGAFRSVAFWVVTLSGLIGVLVSIAASAQGRGDYFNVESPQAHPIEVALVDGHFYILVCNTADSSIEIWDSDESLLPESARFLARVPVGLEPVSVRYVPSLSRFFVANFLGDSISSVFISAPTGPASLQVRVLSTHQVTDEPVDLAFAEVDNGGGAPIPTLFVTHMTLDAYGEYNALTLQPVAPNTERIDAVVVGTIDHDGDGEVDDFAVKSPRTLAVACDKLFILGLMGGNSVRYDLDLYSEDLISASPSQGLGGLGSTNWNMEFADDQNLFVVGAEARNGDLFGEGALKVAPTGFVENMFYWVQNPCSANPTILARDVNEVFQKVLEEPGPPVPVPVSSRGSLGVVRDAAIAVSTTKAVAKQNALVQLTDIEVLKDAGGTVTKAFVTAFGSDRVGVIEPKTGQPPIKWKRRKIDLPPVNSPVGTFIGPRGLALKPANPANETDPGDRLYVVNRLENSVSIIDPLGETVVGGFSLNNDPTPAYIQAGREFLYSAKLSGKGFAACASCHPDGRTDGLSWNLSDGMVVTIPPRLLPPNSTFPTEFPGEKGFMVTQSLQGLLNWEVGPNIQQLYTNGPYHWREDRETFQSFNGAFASLFGATELSGSEIAAFEEFINSIHYPPNPKQPFSRILSGDLGDPDDNDRTQNIDGNGALKGLKMFHTVEGNNQTTCNSCHSLPEGSNNVLLEDLGLPNPHPVLDPDPNTGLPNGDRQPGEPAALRFLFQKEARLDRDGFDNPDDSPITGYEGLAHTGLTNGSKRALQDFNGTATINSSNTSFFPDICLSAPDTFCDNIQAVNQFLHEFDTGIAPQVGRVWTVTSDNVSSAETAQAFQDAEDQAGQANASVAVRANLAGVERGFWLDLSGSQRTYREEPGGALFSRATLLALVAPGQDRMFLLSTPLGSEIRIAAPSGIPTVPTGSAPTDLSLQPMVTNTAYGDVPLLSLFWASEVPGPNTDPEFGNSLNHTVRLYQNALLADAPGGFGLCQLRHEAPRRFRVSGKNIRHGAELHLFVQDDASLGAPITALTVDDGGQVPTLEMTLPIHPTEKVDPEGDPIWETAAELEPLIYYRLMAGVPTVGPPGVLDALTALEFNFFGNPEAQPPGTWQPLTWNQHWVRVVNADGTAGDGGWQQLTIERGPLCPP